MRFDKERTKAPTTEIMDVLTTNGVTTPEGVCVAAYLLYKMKLQGVKVSFEEIIEGGLEVTEEVRLAAQRNLTAQVWDGLNEVEVSLETLKTIILHADDYTQNSTTGMYTSPEALIDLANGILDIHEGDIVADLGSGYGTYLVKTAIDHPKAVFYGYDIDTSAKVIAGICADVAGAKLNLNMGNILSLMLPENADRVPKGRFNRIFSNSPIGLRLRQMQDQPGIQQLTKKYPGLERPFGTADWAFMASVMELLTDNGKAVCLTTNGCAFNLTDKEIRKQFVEEGLIETVIALPPKMLSFTSIPLSLIVLSHGNKNIRMVDATDLYEPGRRFNLLTSEHMDIILDACLGDTEYSKEIAIKEIRENDYNLYPVRYISVEQEIENGVLLGDIARSVSRGAHCTAKELDEMNSQVPTNYQYVSMANIQNGILDENLPYLKGINSKDERYLAAPESLIISRVSYPFKVGIVDAKPPVQILVTDNLYVIELNKEVADPVYVKAYLESDAGQNALKAVSSGVALPIISIEAIKKVKIPLPSMDIQRKVSAEYQAAQDEVIILRHRLQKAQDRLAHVLDTVKED